MITTVKSKRWTYEEMVAQLPAESRYELRDFQLMDMPAPKPKHQRIVFKLGKMLDRYIEEENLGEVFISPLDVVFQRGDVAQPDLIFVSAERSKIIKESHISGAPDLLVEVVSKGSVARDYIEKKADYERFGVKEYWIIDSLNQTIWVYALDAAGKYELVSVAEEEEEGENKSVATSKLLPNFSLPHQAIFEG